MRQYMALALSVLSIVPGMGHARDSVEVLGRASRDSDLLIAVWCRDGAYYRGEPVEYVPNDHVTLRLSDGKVLRLDWNNVASVDGMPPKPVRARSVPLAAPSTQNPTIAADPVREKETNRRSPVNAPETATVESVVNMPIRPGNTPVQVRFSGMREGAMIEYLAHSAEINSWGWPGGFVSGTADTWKEICALPCRVNADRDTSMRIYGPYITSSRPFLLPTRGSRFEVEIKPGWDSTRTAAWALLGVGIGLGAVGSIVVSVATYETSDPLKTNLYIGGGALFGAGLLSAIISIPVFSKSKTDVEVFVE